MICGSCPFTDNLCYCSLPQKVKCTITNEFHLYEDECNCVEAMTSKKETLDFLVDKLSEPPSLMALNYDGPDAPSVSFIGSSDDPTYSNIIRVCENAVDMSLLDSEAWRWSAPTIYGSTPCIVCGTGIEVYSLFDNKQKICSACQKAVLYIREKFKHELDHFEYSEGCK